MKSPILKISHLNVTVPHKLVLQDFSMSIQNEGEIAAVVGPNGSGKSSLFNVLLGNESYRVSENQKTKKPKIEFEGKDLLAMTSDERARAGLYVAWQNPVVIPGVSVFNLCRASYEARGGKIDKLTEFRDKLESLAVRVGLTKEYIARSVNEGFSGGERKRLELLQLLLLFPKLAVLDEVDSGLDSKGVNTLIAIISEMRAQGTSFILISHNKKLIEKIGIKNIWKTTS